MNRSAELKHDFHTISALVEIDSLCHMNWLQMGWRVRTSNKTFSVVKQESTFRYWFRKFTFHVQAECLMSGGYWSQHKIPVRLLTHTKRKYNRFKVKQILTSCIPPILHNVTNSMSWFWWTVEWLPICKGNWCNKSLGHSNSTTLLAMGKHKILLACSF